MIILTGHHRFFANPNRKMSEYSHRHLVIILEEILINARNLGKA